MLIFANPAFIYFLTFIFEKEETGSLVVKMIYFVIGIIAPIAISILQVVNSSTANYGWSLTQSSGNFYIGSQPDTGTSTKIITINRTNANVLIQNSTTVAYANASAQLQIDSTTKGFLPPRMTTTQKNAIGTPAQGLMVFDTTLVKLCVYSGTAWETITSI